MNQIEPKIISEISSSLEIDLTAKASDDEIRSSLTDRINYLITHDFNKLVAILYRIDINEKLLRRKLETEEQDAGSIIANMIIERQIQKLKAKQEFRPNEDISGEDKW
jgi:hypothetical protein